MIVRKTCKIDCNSGGVRDLQNFVEKFGRDQGLEDSAILRLNLVLEELFTNTMRHGHDRAEGQHVEISLAIEGHELQVHYCDDGKPFNPLSDAPKPDLTKTADDRPIGGLGVHLVRTLASASTYKRIGDRNELTITMPL